MTNAAPSLFLLFFGCFYLGIFAVAILGSIFWIWMLVDCATKEPSGDNNKVVWILVIALTHLVGALIYYFVRRPERKRLFGQ